MPTTPPLVPRPGFKSSPKLEALIRDCLAKTPEQRPQSAVELKRRLLDALDSPGEMERPAGTIPQFAPSGLAAVAPPRELARESSFSSRAWQQRRSADLDLFTRERENYDTYVRQFLRLLEGTGLPATAGSAGPGFRRFILSDGKESVPVDVVLDTAEAIAAPTVAPEGLVVDSLGFKETSPSRVRVTSMAHGCLGNMPATVTSMRTRSLDHALVPSIGGELSTCASSGVHARRRT